MIVIVGSAAVLVALAEGSDVAHCRKLVMRGRIHVPSDGPLGAEMATNNTVFLALVVSVAMALSAVFAWTAGNNRNKHRAAPPIQRPASMPAEVGDDRPAATATRHRSALDSSTTQWDRADTRDVTKGASS